MPPEHTNHVVAAGDGVVVPTAGAVSTLSDLVVEGRTGKSKRPNWGGYIKGKLVGLLILSSSLEQFMQHCFGTSG